MGELFLVGMGPGDLPGLTQRAREALEGAEVVIGDALGSWSGT